MLQTRTGARDAAGPRPGSRECLDGRVLTAAGYQDAVRWRDGDRLEHVYEARCDWLREHGQPDHLAAGAGDITLTYGELGACANQLARFLVRRGVRPGDRIGLLLDAAADGYVPMLAVLKAHAAYVPLDAAFPAGRLAFITADAGLRLVLTHSRLAGPAEPLAKAGLLWVDRVRDLLAAEPAGRLGPDEAGAPADDLCYVIYTSGTTGRPKGAAISHASICNLVPVAAEVYGITDGDRVCARLRGRLPSCMVPAYLEQLPALPVLPSGKTDRKSLPPPSSGRRLAGRGSCTAPAGGTERDLPGHITIGSRCTIGTDAFVRYGVTIGDGAIVDTDSFVMKGDHIPPHARWQGNPAAGVPDHEGRRPPAHQPATHELAGQRGGWTQCAAAAGREAADQADSSTARDGPARRIAASPRWADEAQILRFRPWGGPA
jgi:hypothetical protein